MSLGNAICIALALSLPIVVTEPALAQPALALQADASAGTNVGSDSNETFMSGLRRVGVMAGEVVQCTPAEDRQQPIADTMQLANQIALHFGLAAAFTFSGAVGYGAGKPFDKSGCGTAISGWNAITLKYLNK